MKVKIFKGKMNYDFYLIPTVLWNSYSWGHEFRCMFINFYITINYQGKGEGNGNN
jgi:hypothetical protein